MLSFGSVWSVSVLLAIRNCEKGVLAPPRNRGTRRDLHKCRLQVDLHVGLHDLCLVAAIPVMTPQETRLKNDLAALGALHKFGWLRAQELGWLLWPHTKKHGHTQACRAAQSWVERGLMIARELPGHSGRAYVLGAQGVKMLEQIGIKASTGTHIGSFSVDNEWSPAQTWAHDLLTAGLLVRLAADLKIETVYTEKEILRAGAPAVKIADALVVYRCGKVSWIEVEQAKKSDPTKMKLLGQALSAAANGTMEVVCLMPSNRAEPNLYEPAHEFVKVKVNAAMVVFDVASRHNHKKNVGCAIARETNSAVNIEWAACTTSRSGVSSIEYSADVIHPDEVAKIAVRLNAGASLKAKIGLANADELEGNYGNDHWEIHKKDMSVHINGVEKAAGLSSFGVAKNVRDMLMTEAVQERKQSMVAQSQVAKSAVDVDPGKAVLAVAAKEREDVRQFKNMPNEQRTYKGTLYILQSHSLPRTYQVRHDELIVAQGLSTIDAARSELMKYYRDCERALKEAASRDGT